MSSHRVLAVLVLLLSTTLLLGCDVEEDVDAVSGAPAAADFAAAFATALCETNRRCDTAAGTCAEPLAQGAPCDDYVDRECLGGYCNQGICVSNDTISACGGA